MRTFSVFIGVIYFLVFQQGGVEGNIALYDAAGLSLSGVQQGHLWQLVSYALLHGNWFHVIANTTVLYLLGERLQSLLSWKKALCVTLGGVVLGGMLHLLLCLFLDVPAQSLLVGSSGAVMAVLLALTTLQPYRVLWPLRLRAKHLGNGFLISSLGLTLLMPSLGILGLSQAGVILIELFGESVFQVSHACHLGGGMAGVLLVRYWRRKSVV